MPFGIEFNLFGSGATQQSQQESAKDMVRAWQRKLRAEARTIDRNIRKIEQEEEKMKKDIKGMAAKGADPKNIQMLAKALVRSGKGKARLYTSRSVMQSVAAELESQAATMRLSDAMCKSTEVMRQMNSLVKIPEMEESMTSLQREMMRAGLVEEMLDEGIEAMDGPELEEEAEDEVNRVLDELAVDASLRLQSSKAGVDAGATSIAAPSAAMPSTAPAAAAASAGYAS
eukprot:TRINITY_DN63608_c0_g1_i1.p1 TRINITY_DN63608_c0_g1~~TRINITY_DN63608_c0_g1_i1.p1  ORF type:complete len:229 (-),score=74.69 TRINITY_DN63608_c0_g1_i1:10-696(-)